VLARDGSRTDTKGIDGHAGAFAVPAACDKQDLNVAAFVNIARGESAVHIVNNAASCPAVALDLPAESFISILVR
jgi:hypothetical protein